MKAPVSQVAERHTIPDSAALAMFLNSVLACEGDMPSAACMSSLHIHDTQTTTICVRLAVLSTSEKLGNRAFAPI